MNVKQHYAFLYVFCFTIYSASAIQRDSLPLLATTYRLKANETFKGYMRLNIENDMLILRQKTDRYFTSGLKLDYFFLENPSEKMWFSKIFPKLKNGDNFYGLTVVSNMYTPANMTETIVPGDRPYAGWAYAGMLNMSNDKASGTRFLTEYSLGAIGPIVMQERIQCKWHEIIGRPVPHGWKKSNSQ